MSLAFDRDKARRALTQLPHLAAQEDLCPPDLARVYVPSQHLKALHLDASIVVGMRGAGKSWWTAVLASDTHRGFVSDQLSGSSLAKVTAKVGFGLDDSEENFPGPETLEALIVERVDPFDIWLTVVLHHVFGVSQTASPFLDLAWKDRVRWLIAHRDEANSILTECDQRLASDGRVLLVLFDAFDRLSSKWERVRLLTSGAFRLGLRLRSRRSIRTKFFIRPDLDEDEDVWGFPDSSKLRHAKVTLTWGSADLYGLVFMHLGNAHEFGREFRSATGKFSLKWTEMDGVHVPSKFITDEKLQRDVVEALADRNMGGGPKRGYTYSWIPLHLADAKGGISPRSYILAFKVAAEYTADRYPEHGLALRFAAIQQGVVRASQVRVDEIGEDYPWVKPLLEAARGAVVPFTADDVSRLWDGGPIEEVTKAAGKKLPPRRFASDRFRTGADALIDDLVELGVFYRTKDGRLNMPDIFRVGFGVRRKGGVKPPR